jgi:hypothetical protein
MDTPRHLSLWLIGTAVGVSALVLAWSELGHHVAGAFDSMLNERREVQLSRPEVVPPGVIRNSKGFAVGTTSVPWLAAAIVSAAAICALHRLSLGQTGPFAALGFFIGGPLLGVVVFLFYAHKEARWLGRELGYVDPQLAAFNVYTFGSRLLCLAVVSAAVVGLIAAVDKHDEWFNHL